VKLPRAVRLRFAVSRHAQGAARRSLAAHRPARTRDRAELRAKAV